MATLEFNRKMKRYAVKYANSGSGDEITKQFGIYAKAINKGAMFDARVFSIPKDEVCNCLIWRQQDATRNSIEAVGQANFSQKELHGKSCNSIQDMLWKEHGINWNDFPVDCKRGSACYKTKVKETAPLLNDKGDTEMVEVVRNRWVIDREPPIFSQEREYVEKWI